MTTLFTAILASIAAAAVAFVAYRRRSLTGGGAVAAAVVGAVVVIGGGWWWGATLIAFFVSSSLLSAVRERGKRSDAGMTARGARRDAVQVGANGGVGAIVALLAIVTDSSLLLPAFAGSVAAATADTWATEIGGLSPRPPRSITSGRVVPAGTSGGVTALGSAASLIGGLAIGMVAAVGAAIGGVEMSWELTVVAATAGGFAGSLIDSLLGATVQVAYHCPACDEATEQPVHRCGTRTRRTRGWPGATNDAVNLAATASGAFVALLVALAH